MTTTTTTTIFLLTFLLFHNHVGVTTAEVVNLVHSRLMQDTSPPTGQDKSCNEVHLRWACEARVNDGCVWAKGACGYPQTPSPGTTPTSPLTTCNSIKTKPACDGKPNKCMWNSATRTCVQLKSTPSPTSLPTNKKFLCTHFTSKVTCCGPNFGKSGKGPCINVNSAAGCMWVHNRCLDRHAAPGTKSPTMLPTVEPALLRNSSMQAWQEFFDATGGSSWAKCAKNRIDPCSCSATLVKRTISVTCDSGGVIRAIQMRANKLTAPYYPQAALSQLFASGLQSLDISHNSKLKATSCVSLPLCFKTGITCDIAPATICAVVSDISSAPTFTPTLSTASDYATPSISPTLAVGISGNDNTNSPTMNLTHIVTPAPSPAPPATSGAQCNVMSDCNTGFCKGGRCCASPGWAYTCLSCGPDGLCNMCDSASYLQNGMCLERAPTFQPTQTFTPTVNANDLHPEVLTAWTTFFDATGGSSWYRCSSNRLTPCLCNTVLVNRPISVTCVGGSIISIVMAANHLKSPYFPTGVFNTMFSLGLKHLEIENNMLLQTNGFCVSMPACSNSDVFCSIAPSFLCPA